MPDNEPLQEAEAEAPENPIRARVKKLLRAYPPGPFDDVIRVGLRALHEEDLQLAKASANFVISRAPTGSGDLMRAQALRGLIYDVEGNARKAGQLLESVIREVF